MSPDQVHEVLVIAVLIAMLPAGLLAMLYLRALNDFFGELKVKEPELWRRIGHPGLLNMVALPFLRFRKYTAFLPHLRQRAKDPESGYDHAGRAYVLLLAGLSLVALMFALVAVTIAWIFYHGL